MVTVIIPAFNEQETIGKVVKFCLQEPTVNEVIVVDDQSTDDTREQANAAGAVVIKSQKRGKGVSMKEGISSSRNQYLVFLDADIYAYPAGTIKKMVQPIIDNECDFVKGAFFRNAGKVTELVAKPLLKIFYPELSSFSQPLSSMIAGKKSFLRKLDFFEDYGVDIGILIDMHLMRARVKEVNIGYIENKGKSWQLLGTMTHDIANAIMLKTKQNQGHKLNLDQLGAVNKIAETLARMTSTEITNSRKLYLFSLDQTLIQEKFIDACASHFSFEKELNRLRRTEKDPTALIKRMAILLKGVAVDELHELADSIPLVTDAIETISQLRKRGNIVGIVSESYQVVVDFYKQKLGTDFALANQLPFFEGKVTGETSIPTFFYYQLDSKCQHALCKTNALMHIAHKYDIAVADCIAIGSEIEDLCMIENAGMGIAFCTKNKQIRNAADLIIDEPSFASLIGNNKPATPVRKKRSSSSTVIQQ